MTQYGNLFLLKCQFGILIPAASTPIRWLSARPTFYSVLLESFMRKSDPVVEDGLLLLFFKM